jgi:hypothetical protein
MLDVGRGTLRIGVPAPEVRPVFTAAQQRQYGVRSSGGDVSVTMPVLRVAF